MKTHISNSNLTAYAKIAGVEVGRERRLLKLLGKNSITTGDELALTFGKVVWTPNCPKHEKCRECGRRFSLNEIVWCYFTSNEGVIGYICVNCYEKGAHLSLTKTISTNYEIDW